MGLHQTFEKGTDHVALQNAAHDMRIQSFGFTTVPHDENPFFGSRSTLLRDSHDQRKQEAKIASALAGVREESCESAGSAELPEWKKGHVQFKKGNGTVRQDEDLSLIN